MEVVNKSSSYTEYHKNHYNKNKKELIKKSLKYYYENRQNILKRKKELYYNKKILENNGK